MMSMTCIHFLSLFFGDVALGLLVAYGITRNHRGLLLLCLIVAILFNVITIIGLITLDPSQC